VEIAPEADRQKATVQIKVKIESPDQFLRPDMNASVSFQEEPKTASEKSRRTTQVVIPQSAVRDNSVFVVLNGRATQRKVLLGGSSPAGVRVLSGLTDGEDIIVNPPADLKDGDKVRRRERR
jgi:HlyD family secretion protein